MVQLEREAPPVWGMAQHIQHLQKLLEREVVGFYHSFEVTEILGFHADAHKQPVNFFTLMVAEPAISTDESQPVFLNNARVELSEKRWKFGVVRYRISTEKAIIALQKFDTDFEWIPNGISVKIGDMVAVPPQFVPTDGPEPHPWNTLLKNNYWEGSHILELFDRTKNDVKFLLEEPQLLTKLAEKIRPIANINLDGLSDRIGNIVIQFPVTVLSTVLNSTDSNGAFSIQPIWHPSATPRRLRVTCEKYEDNTVEGYDSKDVCTEIAEFLIASPGGGARYVLWDDTNQIILGASAKTQFISSVAFNIQSITVDANTRTFAVPSNKEVLEEVHIPIFPPSNSTYVGCSPFNTYGSWRSRRVFSNSLHALKERKEFVQYGGKSGLTREDAIKDIHFLIRRHGEFGAWLWDPYLSADDILQTLFYSNHKNADLRALSAGKDLPSSRSQEKKRASELSWKDSQRDKLNTAKGNCYGLKLEYRLRQKGAGWDFHDSFLIFPSAAGGATAWSLGTSVNSLGHKHHILQKVQDGERISQAFLDLWNALENDEYLIWKNP